MKYIFLLLFFLIQNASAKTWSLNEIILKTLENSLSIQIIQAQKKGDQWIQTEALAPFDWQAGWNYTLPRVENSFNLKNFNSHFSLQKKWLYGLHFKTDYCYAAGRANCANAPSLSNPYSKTVSLNIEQNILRNFFGREDRLKLQSANDQYKSLKLARKEDMQKLVLNTAEKFWNSYILNIHVQQAKKTQSDYKELVELIQKKSKLGHIQPGEAPQILSQYERTLKQQKEMETQFKNSMIELKEFTQIKDKKFKFQKHRTFSMPHFSPVKDIEKLNIVQINRTHHSSELALLDSQKYFYLPYIKLYAGADFSGNKKGWMEILKSPETKNYKIGVNFMYPLSHSPARWKRSSSLQAKKLQHELEYQDHKQKIRNQLKTNWNQLKTAQNSLKASFKILKLQKQALNEIRQSYIQGRIPIDRLISAQDRSTEVKKENLQAQKNYNLSLLKYYTLRDELLSRYQK